jgi:hypothetical protein
MVRLKDSILPERPDLDVANRWLVDAHRLYWRDTSLML